MHLSSHEVRGVMIDLSAALTALYGELFGAVRLSATPAGGFCQNSGPGVQLASEWPFQGRAVRFEGVGFLSAEKGEIGVEP